MSMRIRRMPNVISHTLLLFRNNSTELQWAHVVVSVLLRSTFGPYLLPAAAGSRPEHFAVYALLALFALPPMLGINQAMLPALRSLLFLWAASALWTLPVTFVSGHPPSAFHVIWRT